MKVAIGSIRLNGQRRREDLGDIGALAQSLKRYGLIHPIVITDEGVLVAGQRRLEAARSLGWTEIETRNLGDLTAAELRLLELEENIQRKDLTAYERSKVIVEAAETAREVLQGKTEEQAGFSLDSNEKPAWPTAKSASQAKAAEYIGISQPALSLAERHVQAVEKYPILKTVSQDRALKTAALLEKYPPLTKLAGLPEQILTMGETLEAEEPSQREADIAALERGDSNTITRLAGLPPLPPVTEQDIQHNRALAEMRSVQKWLRENRVRWTKTDADTLAAVWSKDTRSYALECIGVIRSGLDALEAALRRKDD